MQGLAEPAARTSSPGAPMKITPLGRYVGAEVTGIDLRQPLDAATRKHLNDAVAEHIALVIRDQNFTPAEFVEAARVFGTPICRPSGSGSLDDNPIVHRISSREVDTEGNAKKTGTRWHTDHTNLECPTNYTILYAVELPVSGGGTSVCSMRDGYKALPDDIRRRADTMQTENVILGSAARSYGRGLADTRSSQKSQNPTPVVHPLVRTHPVTGAKALYFNPLKTETIVGMSPEDAQDFMELLIEHAVRPEFTYTHEWRLGDIFLGHNRSSLHKAGDDYEVVDGRHRTLLRIIADCERPV